MLRSSVVQCSSLFIFLSYLRLSFESFTLPARAGDAFMAVELTSLATVYFGLLRSQLSFSSFVHPTVCLPDCVSVCLSVCLSLCLSKCKLFAFLYAAFSCATFAARCVLLWWQLFVCLLHSSLFSSLSLSLCCRFLSFFRFVSF